MFAFVYILGLAATVAAIAVPVDPVLGITLTSTPKATSTKAGTTTTTTTTTTASPSATAVIPDPSEVTINSISYGGTGCPQGSVGTFISDDRETFTIIFDSYVASIGPGIAITNNRLNCQLNIDLQYPSGFQYSVLSTEFRGYAALDKGVTGTQQATYYFSGSSAQASSSTVFTGPTSGDYEIEDSIPFTSTVWSPCGAALPLNINSQVRLTSTVSTANGILTDDSIDGNVQFVVGVQWQTC